MKKSEVLAMLLLSIILMPSTPMTLAASNRIFYEGFENYGLGKFSSTDDWTLEVPWDAEPENQRIVDTASVSGIKSIQLMAETAPVSLSRTFEYSSNFIGYQVFVMVTERWYVQTYTMFSNSLTETGFSAVLFEHDSIYARTYSPEEGRYIYDFLQAYEPNEWYNITVFTNIDTLEFSVWINGLLKGTSFREEPDRSQWGPIDSVWVDCRLGRSIKTYFDDISVFEKLEEPSEGDDASPKPPPSDEAPNPLMWFGSLFFKIVVGVGVGGATGVIAAELGLPSLLSTSLAGLGPGWLLPFVFGGLTSAVASEIARAKFGWSTWNSVLFGTALGSSVNIGTTILLSSFLGISLTPIGWALAATIALGVLVSFAVSYFVASGLLG